MPRRPADTFESATVELEMSIHQAEFARLLRRLSHVLHAPLTGQHPAAGISRHTLRLPAGDVSVHFQPCEPIRLGALRLPRARISLRMHSLPAPARADFMAAFRRTFQRGGG